MKKFIYAITLTAMMALTACGDKGTTDQSGVISAEEFTSDVHQLENSEANLKSVGFRFTKKNGRYTWDQESLKRKWNRGYDAAINTQVLPALRSYQANMKYFLGRYGGKFVLHDTDGTIEEKVLREEKRTVLFAKDEVVTRAISTLENRRDTNRRSKR